MSTAAQPGPSSRRVGDAERDDAASLLRDHLAAGRLDYGEFDQRLGSAMAARTEADLTTLFADLPGRRPGESAALPAVASPVAWTPAPVPVARPKPWWATGYVFLAAFALTVLSRGELGPLIPIAALWVWVVAPSVLRRREQTRLWREQQRRELDH